MTPVAAYEKLAAKVDAVIDDAEIRSFIPRGSSRPARVMQAPAEAQQARPPISAVTVQELAEMRFKPRIAVLEPFLHSQDLAMVFAPRGIGKTHLCLSMAYAIATGGALAKWLAPEPRRVLYLDGELPGVVMQKRLMQHCPDVEPEPGFFRVFTPDLLPDDVLMPDLSTADGQEAIGNMVGDAQVVFLDNLSAWARSGRENEAESWLPIADWLLRLRRRGVAVVLVHHAGKGGQQRGTSKREDLLDVVIGLSRPKDYNPVQGAVFVAEFSKGRHLLGTDAESIELQMGGDDDRVQWTWRTVEASTYDRVVALAKEGLKGSEIAAELEINKSTVSRHLRRAKELGNLTAEAAS
jgi:putative DNA primase/helicase